MSELWERILEMERRRNALTLPGLATRVAALEQNAWQLWQRVGQAASSPPVGPTTNLSGIIYGAGEDWYGVGAGVYVPNTGVSVVIAWTDDLGGSGTLPAVVTAADGSYSVDVVSSLGSSLVTLDMTLSKTRFNTITISSIGGGTILAGSPYVYSPNFVSVATGYHAAAGFSSPLEDSLTLTDPVYGSRTFLWQSFQTWEKAGNVSYAGDGTCPAVGTTNLDYTLNFGSGLTAPAMTVAYTAASTAANVCPTGISGTRSTRTATSVTEVTGPKGVDAVFAACHLYPSGATVAVRDST